MAKQKKPPVIQVYLNAEQHSKALAKAEIKGYSASHYARELVLADINQAYSKELEEKRR